MARQIVVFIVAIVLLTCTSGSWGQTCNWTIHEATSRVQLKHEKRLLDGWIGVANGFVHTVAPKDLDALEEVAELVNGNKDGSNAKDVILKVLKIEVAFAACLFLGLIYFLTMGTGWSCFLCCRCCGNCGANKTQRQTKTINSRRCIYVVLTIGVLGFLAAAVATAFMANEELSLVMTKGQGSIENVIHKLELYVNNTQKEITTLDTCFEDTRDDIISRAGDETINEELAEPLKENILNESASIIISLEKLNQDFRQIKGLKEKVASVKSKEQRVRELENKISELKQTCEPTSSDAECIEIEKLKPFDFKEIQSNSFSQIPPAVHQVIDINFLSEFLNPLNQLPKKIVEGTVMSRNALVKEIKSYTQNKDIVNEIEQGVIDFRNEINNFEEKLNISYKKHITDQEVYRYWGVFGLIMFVALPSGLLFLGLCCGLLGSKSGRYPSERSGLSHCGGCTMMASVYLMFILGSLAMLFTVAFFQVGGHAEAYGCRYLYEKDLGSVDRVLRLFLPNTSNSKVLEQLKSLKVGEIASKCDGDATIYEAVPSIEDMLNVNLTFDKDIDDIKFDGYKIEINQITLEALNQVQKDMLKIYGNLDINVLQNLVGLAKEQIIKANIGTTVEEFKSYPSSSNNERNKLLKETLEILEELKEAAEKRGEITTTLGTDGAEIARYKKLVDGAFIRIKTEVVKITPTITSVAQQMIQNYCEEIVHHITNFTKEATKIIKGKVGKCGTLYDAFSLGRHFACKEVLGPLNALWFSLGMCCFFFLFAIPFATKLSKHFYIMDEDEDSYIGMDSLQGHHMYINGYAEHQVALHKGGNMYEKEPQRPTYHQNGAYEPDTRPRHHQNRGYEPDIRPRHHQNGAYEPDVEDRWTRY